MLNGISPVIIFHFGTLPTASRTFKAISGIPLIGDTIAANIGIPIPIYLDEKITGLQVKNQGTQVDMNEDVTTKENEKTPDVKQRAINSIVTINMQSSKNNVVTGMLIALNDLIFTKLSSKTYSVSWLCGSTVVLNGLIHGFSAIEQDDKDLVDIVLQISKANKKVESPTQTLLPKITGALPVSVVQ